MMASSSFLEEFERASSILVSTARSGDTEDKVACILNVLRALKSLDTAARSQLFVSFEVLKTLRLFLVSPDKDSQQQRLRVQAVRSMRFMTLNGTVLQQMVRLNIPFFMMMNLERDSSSKYEQLGALKWIKVLMQRVLVGHHKSALS